MSASSISAELELDTHVETALHEKMPVRTVGRKATITKEELFQAALNLIGPQKVFLL